MADDTSQCRTTDCQVALTGNCAEGHTPLASCPNYGDQPAEESDVHDGELDEVAEESSSDVDRVSLPSGNALTPDEVAQFLQWRAATFVAIIGDRDGGKTTLICALYDRFLQGVFGELGFAGSRTLVALEQLLHHAREESGRTTPDTWRTSLLEGLHYFHFAVASNGHPEKRTDLLLSDRSGEVYGRARNDSSLVATLAEIPQADRIVLLLDGRRVADPIERAGVIQSVRQTLRVFRDNGALGPTSIVQVVTTKIDLIAASQDGQEIGEAMYPCFVDPGDLINGQKPERDSERHRPAEFEHRSEVQWLSAGAEDGESQAVGKSANRFSRFDRKDHVPCWGHYTKVL